MESKNNNHHEMIGSLNKHFEKKNSKVESKCRHFDERLKANRPMHVCDVSQTCHELIQEATQRLARRK